MTAKPVVLPEIARLSHAEVNHLHPDLADRIIRVIGGREAKVIDSITAGAYALARGSIFVAAPEVKHPFLFTAKVASTKTHDGRAYIVVAREYGDLSWPAWLKNQRAMVSGDVTRLIQTRLGAVKDWCTPGWRTLHHNRRLA